MKRNRGLIGPKGKVKTTSTNSPWSRIFDQHDGVFYAGEIPQRPNITGVTFSGDGWDSSNNTWYWGANVDFNIQGTGLTGSYATVSYEIVNTAGINTNYFQSSLTGQLSVPSSTGGKFTNKLKTQRFPVNGGNFQVKVWLGTNTSGTPTFTSSVYTIADFTISTSMADVNEGQTATGTLTVGGLANSGIQYVRTRVYSNNITTPDWTANMNQQYNYSSTVTNHQKVHSFTIGTAFKDVLNENNENFALVFQGYPLGDTSYNTFYSIGGDGDTVTIIDSSYFDEATLSASSGNEGDSITVTVYGYGSLNSVLTVEVEGGTGTGDAADLTGVPSTVTLSSTSGSRNYGSFTCTIARDFLTEGTQTLRFKFLNSQSQIVGYSGYLTIGDTTTLSSITSDTTNINETDSATVNFTVNVTGGVGGSTYTQHHSVAQDSATHFAIVASDFTDSSLQGTFSINGTTNVGTFSKTARTDTYIEGPESFKVKLGNTDDKSFHVDTGLVINIEDTSATSSDPEPITKFLRSKGLTGAQTGITTYTYVPSKDMAQNNSARQIPSGYNPRNPAGNLTPSNTPRYYWNDWGGDWFDQWGDFYIFNPADQTARYISFATEDGPDGTIYTETQTHYSETFQIKHGWVVQGIFKLEISCTSSETFSFAVGFYGNMGSDGSTQNADNTSTQSWGTLNYNYNSQNNTSEYFYVHVIPRVKSVNDAINIDTTGMHTNVYGNDNLAIWTDALTHGVTCYFVKGSNSTTGANYDWIGNDIEIDQLNYYS